jgi:hypothetical protein
LTVQRWCEIGTTPPEAQEKIRTMLATEVQERLDRLGIRFANEDFVIPVRTLIILGRKA